MQFKVSGINRETGARMSLQFEAGSKAGAERKATQAGMEVHRCEPAKESAEGKSESQEKRASNRGEEPPGGTAVKTLFVAIILLIAIGASVFFLLPRIRAMFH